MTTSAKDSKAAPPSDDESTIKVAPKKDSKDKDKDKPNGLKLKKSLPKIDKPGNWRHGSVADDKKKGGDTPSTNSAAASPGPIVNPVDDALRDSFSSGRPMEDKSETLKCNTCKKAILQTAFAKHNKECQKAKAEKLKKKKEAKEAREREKREEKKENDKDEEGDTKMDDDDDNEEEPSPEKKGPGGLKSAKKSAGKKVDVDDSKKGKKRKAEGDAEKGPKQKKKKEEPKPKVPKQRGPVDVERQCGVLKDGVACARSLTCKSHSMGAKRAVPGRSLPYDMLLAAYQKKNQAKQQKAAIDANAPLEDEEEGNGPVDSDEELTAVMHGLSNWEPQPVVPPLVHVPIEKEYHRRRLRDQLMTATNNGTVNIFKVVGYGAQKLPPGHPGLQEEGPPGQNGEETAEGLGIGMANVAARRASGFNMQMPPQRRPSGSQR
ncbi:SCA7-domain-containing protein [Mollisia scopiformis]|uniref:SCA7-domain-containing protein n=1 Tax=Mollisia scopiformis TaxID=149040 RepID=A0A194XHI5_MOLSC|nr:SCA7-domain-containing protein [Mollisia scopiformis]KUJ19596.1 SCA7-domain-containing protein [Mollisia scopiformis]